MAYKRVPGSAGRYVDTETGDTISRRQYEQLTRPREVANREDRYRARRIERRNATGFISPITMAENKRYWLQRFSEQAAVRNNTTDAIERDKAMRPGSEFNRLWSAAQAEGFDGGSGSAWDALSYRAGAKAGDENEAERNKYLAVISWYMRNDKAGNERWVARGNAGRFTWDGMPDSDRRRISKTG